MPKHTEADHAAFLKALKESDAARYLVAEWMAYRGWSVEPLRKVSYAPTAADWRAHADNGDLYAVKGDVRARFEVKQLSIEFTNIDDWPFPNAIVDGRFGYEKSDPKPTAYIQLSRSRKCAAIVDVGATHKFWTLGTKKDHRHENPMEFYFAPVNVLRFETLPDEVLERVRRDQVVKASDPDREENNYCKPSCEKKNWKDEQPIRRGDSFVIRTHCKVCRKFIGYRLKE